MSPSRFEGRHEAVLATPTTALAPDQRPVQGPIAILPISRPRFEKAVTDAGGTVAPLDDDTRGVIWLDNDGASDLAEVLRTHPDISWVQLPWAGVEGFADVVRGHARPGLIVTSAKGAYAQPVAEHILTLTLALLRELPTRIRARSWGDKAGSSLYGLEIVVVGAGGIAREFLRLAEPFGVTSTVVRRSSEAVPGADRTVTVDRLREVLPTADVVVVAAALTGDTTRLFSQTEFELMKPSAHIVNIARGGLIDTTALVEALESGGIAGAGLDVTDPEPLADGHPLWSTPNTIITPHTADTPEMTGPLLAARIRQNVSAFRETGEFVGVVDPEAGY
ncbi:D-isomer specific 2-hydroxyacid dehydrogenase family protein [Herbiconiux sp.]|uniref:D-isomer specific 2-hydroxyacid dehydrogenase family protein n=1 Tax=Herbiconiux sp. TaxID=1871186 RepID=UPI0025BC5C41|nr:D-isomer specific 2-hydroxyacid dehydrogenase family protein [Herbiconiux sp.]